MVKFECASCGFKKAVDDKYAGKNVRCPKCTNPVIVSTQQIQQSQTQSNQLKIYCPLCNKKIAVPAEYAGKRVRCPNCKNPLDVSASQSPQQPPAIPQVHDDVQSLADMERSAKSVELPPELRPIPVKNEPENQPDLSDRFEMKPKKSKESKQLDLPIGSLIGIIIVIIILGIIVNNKIGSVETKEPAPEYKVKSAESFATDFFDKMTKGDINEVSAMLTVELQQRDPNDLKSLIETFKNKWNPDHKLAFTMSVQSQEGNCFMFGHSLKSNESIVTTVILEDSNGFEIIGLNFDDDDESLVRFESAKCSVVMPDLGHSVAGNILGKFKKASIVLLILFAISRLSKAIIFYRADESPWAAIIPCYHEWTLAETGDKSGGWGIAACLLSGMPFVYLAFIFYASLGIAETHGRGILFGIGLALLPFIFYPILVFSEH